MAVLAIAAFGQAENADIVKPNISQAEIAKIIHTFTQNEKLFREALNEYAFNRYATIQTIGLGGNVTGTYRRDSFLTFTQGGNRFERVTFAPVSTLKDLEVTASDLENLGGLDPFAIEPSVMDKYRFTYLGKEKIDELDLHVFDVSPKVIPEFKKGVVRLFQGRIWVDDQDLMIVKSRGKAVPEGKERFATIDTTRTSVDGKYWFPADSRADDDLVFDSGQVIKIRVRVKYKDYRLGRTDVKIIDEEVLPVEKPSPTPTPSPTPKKPE